MTNILIKTCFLITTCLIIDNECNGEETTTVIYEIYESEEFPPQKTYEKSFTANCVKNNTSDSTCVIEIPEEIRNEVRQLKVTDINGALYIPKQVAEQITHLDVDSSNFTTFSGDPVFHNLHSLVISNNPMTSSAALNNTKAFSKVKHLDISGTKIAFEDVVHHFRNLSSLSLKDCGITSTNATEMLDDLHSLETLNISSNPLTEITLSYDLLHRLVALNASNCNLRRIIVKDRSPANLSSGVGAPSAPSLQYLDLSNNRLSYLEPAMVRSLTRTATVDITGNQLDLTSCSQHPLHELVNQKDSAITLVGAPSQFYNFDVTQTDYCDWSMCPEKCICDEQEQIVSCHEQGLTSIPTIAPSETTHLDLRGNQITSLNGLESFVWKNLRTLYLDYNKITRLSFDGSGPDVLPLLMTLSVSHNEISFICDSDCGIISSLYELNVSNNMLVSLDASPCGHIVASVIDASNNNIKRFRDTELMSIPYVRVLNLSGNSLTSFETCDLRYTPHIQKVNVCYNSIPITPCVLKNALLACNYDDSKEVQEIMIFVLVPVLLIAIAIILFLIVSFRDVFSGPLEDHSNAFTDALPRMSSRRDMDLIVIHDDVDAVVRDYIVPTLTRQGFKVLHNDNMERLLGHMFEPELFRYMQRSQRCLVVIGKRAIEESIAGVNFNRRAVRLCFHEHLYRRTQFPVFVLLLDDAPPVQQLANVDDYRFILDRNYAKQTDMDYMRRVLRFAGQPIGRKKATTSETADPCCSWISQMGARLRRAIFSEPNLPPYRYRGNIPLKDLSVHSEKCSNENSRRNQNGNNCSSDSNIGNSTISRLNETGNSTDNSNNRTNQVGNSTSNIDTTKMAMSSNGSSTASIGVTLDPDPRDEKKGCSNPCFSEASEESPSEAENAGSRCSFQGQVSNPQYSSQSTMDSYVTIDIHTNQFDKCDD